MAVREMLVNRCGQTFLRRFYGKIELKINLNNDDKKDGDDAHNQPVVKHRLYAFGWAEHGALGLEKPGSESKSRPNIVRPIRHFFAEENCVTDIASGFGFTAFSIETKEKIKLYGSGITTDEQIGKQKLPIAVHPVPIDIGLKNGSTKIISMSAGRAHLAIATDNEGTFLLGNNSYGQCGTESNMDSSGECHVQNCIKDLEGKHVDNVFCGQDHTIFLTEGKVYSCGWGSDGQTGQDNTENTTTPTVVKGDIENEKIIKVAGSCDTVLALSDKGELFGWGSNEYAQLFLKEDVQQLNKPNKLKHVNKSGKIVDMAAGGSFCIALTEGGEVLVWGYGILGGGPKLEKTPQPFHIPNTLFGKNEMDDGVKPVSVHCGMSHLMVVNNRSHVYAWGKNRHGCLGIGHLKDQYFPYKIALSALVQRISCGLDHTMVLGLPID